MNSLQREKRKYERFNTDVKIMYRNSDTINIATLKNISMNGMLLVSSEVLPVNTVVTITLSVPGLAANSPKIAVKVLWSKEFENNGYLFGLGMIANYSQTTRFISDIFALQKRANN